MIYRRLADPPLAPQNRGDHLLCGAFPHRAGDANYLHTNAQALLSGNFPQRNAGIRNYNRRVVSVAVGTQYRSSAFFKGSSHEFMTVSDPLQCHKELTGLQLSRVVAGSEKDNILIFGIYFAAAPLGGLL